MSSDASPTKRVQTMTELSPERIRKLMADTEHAARVRSVYHRAMGEAIVFRLTFANAPDFTITEDVAAETVTVSISSAAEPLILYAAEGRDPQDDYDALRAWIMGQVAREHRRTALEEEQRHAGRDLLAQAPRAPRIAFPCDQGVTSYAWTELHRRLSQPVEVHPTTAPSSGREHANG